MKPAFRSILLLAVAAVLPICAFAAGLAFVSWRQERVAVERDALERVRALSLLIDRELAAQVDLVKTLAELPEFDQGDLAAIDRTLRRVQAQQPLWLAALVADPNGTVVVDTQLPVPYAVVDMASLRDVMETKRPAIGNIMKGITQVAFPIRAPVIRDGKVLYAVTAIIRPDAVRTLLFDSTIPGGWLGGVIDSMGRIVARTRDEADFVGKPAAEAVLAARARGGQGLHTGTTLEGLDVVTAYRVSPVTGWSVHIGIPRVIYEEPVRRWMWVIVAGAVGALFLAALFAGFTIREVRVRRDQAEILERGRRMESLGRLTGGIAHDFNNLLTAILGGVQMLRRRGPSPDTKPFLDAIERAAERGAQVTQDLLMFVRSGNMLLLTVDLNERVRGSLGMIRQAVGPEVLVDLDCAPDLSPVITNPIQLDLAILNLASNARDAMGGRGTLRITTSRRDIDGRSLALLSVGDTGHGIAEQHLPYVFEPFYTTKEAARGAGLGLAQVYGFAKQSGGSAEIASKVGQGTTVTICLPMVDAEAASPAAEPKLAADYAVAHRGRLLLVDDNSDVRGAIGDYLRDVGFEVEEAVDAIDALDRIGDQRFDAVVSDIVMPGRMNGVALAQELRRRRPDIPVVLVSGFSDSASDAVAQGWTVIAKPYSFDRLEAAIAEALEASAPRVSRLSGETA